MHRGLPFQRLVSLSDAPNGFKGDDGAAGVTITGGYPLWDPAYRAVQ